MVTFVLAFLAGDLYIQNLANLPSAGLLLMVTITSILLIIFLKKIPYFYLIPAFLIGCSYTSWYAKQQLAGRLPSCLESKTIVATGFVAAIPTHHKETISFLFALENLAHKQFNHHLVRLTWRMPQKQLHVGEKWKLYVKLKKIHGLQNPGGFDFESLSLQKGLIATGYVVERFPNQLLASSNYNIIDQYREKLLTKIIKILPATPTANWLVALILGERNNIAANDWLILRNTGTNHLMAIAGLHIGIIAGMAHFVIKFLVRRFCIRICQFVPLQIISGYAALIAALFYSALAGFSLPTQRASIMLLIFLSGLFLRTKLNPWQVWASALLIVLLLNPLNVLNDSFWLSFGTIAIIFYGMQSRLSPQGIWWKWGRVQWIVGLGLMPLTLVLFHQSSLISFVANSIAIPWLSFLILPFCLLSLPFLFIYSPISAFLLYLSDQSLKILWTILTWLAHLDISVWYQSMPNYIILALSIFAIILLLLPKGIAGKGLGAVFLLPLFCFQAPHPKLNEYWLTVLDVGQGLAILVQTKQHTLIFDTGPRYNLHFDSGESVLSPYLHYQGIKKINTLVVSHGDNDHIGGANYILNHFKVAAIKTSVPTHFTDQSSLCLAGEKWQWDGVSFSFLYPDKNHLGLGNDSSCVLRIENDFYAVLLTGDIEKYAENILVNSPDAKLAAQVLVAGHHGSKTSSTIDFIKKVNPKFVIYATGYKNRYHFPHIQIIERFKKLNVTQLETAKTGAILIKFPNDKNKVEPILYRKQHPHYWHDK